MSSLISSHVNTRLFLVTLFILMTGAPARLNAMACADEDVEVWDSTKPDALGRKRCATPEEQLIKSCCRISNKPKEKRTDAQEVRLALEAKVDPNVIVEKCPNQYYQGFTPLQVVARLNRLEIARLLVEYGAKVDEIGYREEVHPDTQLHAEDTPLQIAAEFHHTKIMELLLSHGANVHVCDARKKTVLHRALRYHVTVEDVRLLIAHKADIHAFDNGGHAALHSAAALRYGNALPIVKLLVANEARINGHGVPGRHEYCTTGSTPLHIAAQQGTADVIKWFLREGGVPANTTDEYGKTPLHRAADTFNRDNATENVRALLNEGAIVNALSSGGLWSGNKKYETPLHEAATRGNVDVAQMLVDARANVNALTSDGKSPLYYALEAAGAGEYYAPKPEDIDAMVKLLLLNGATLPTFAEHEIVLRDGTTKKVCLKKTPASAKIVAGLAQRALVFYASKIEEALSGFEMPFDLRKLMSEYAFLP